MLAALRVELEKFYRTRATYVGPILLLGLVGLTVYGSAKSIKHTERKMKQEMRERLGDDFIVTGKVVSGVTVPRAILALKLPMHVFVAALVAMAAGGAFATEYQTGTLRTLLSRPVRRVYVVLAKWTVNAVHAVGLTLFLGALGLALGYVFLGRGDLVFISGFGPHADVQIQIVPEWQAVKSLAFAYLLQGIGMVAVASIALCISCITSRSTVAAGATLAFMLISGMVGLMSLELEALEPITPYLLTTHLAAFEHVLNDVPDWAEIRTAAFCVAGYIAVPLAAAIAIMGRKEIQC